MILCIDSDKNDLTATREAIEGAGFETRGATSASGAREAVRAADGVDCLVTEYELPDGNGLELVRAVRESGPDTACILYTDAAPEEMGTDAFGEVIAEYVPKGRPNAADALMDLVEHSLASRTQTAYPLPNDEDARLEALERYAEDPESLSDSLGRLTELATALFGVNSAAVGLVDDHEERFLSCYGANFDTRERDRTLCTHTILEEGVMVVEDATEDPRFESLERLERADVRFYAGAPVRTPEGLAIGVFCLHDDEPRALSDRERELLTLLAGEAMEQLELRRQLRGEARA
jgi:CheY-like chemotaxis protein